MIDTWLIFVTAFFVRWLIYGDFTVETFALFMISFLVTTAINFVMSGYISKALSAIFWSAMLILLIRVTGGRDYGGD